LAFTYDGFKKAIGIVERAVTFFAAPQKESDIRLKEGRGNYVTKGDLSVQDFIKKELEKNFKDFDFFSEEQKNLDTDFSKTTWILDPIDGTSNLVHGFRQSAISLGLCENKEITAGVIFQPYTGETFHAFKGKGAYLNGTQIHVSEKAFEKSLILISPYVTKKADEHFQVYREIFKNTDGLRIIGSCALDLAYVACGRADGIVEYGMKLWDYAAGSLIVREAGGVCQDFDGQNLDVQHPSNIVAGNKKCCSELVANYLGPMK
jgi:myo-inositol-1(or 4)-monophosphatase